MVSVPFRSLGFVVLALRASFGCATLMFAAACGGGASCPSGTFEMGGRCGPLGGDASDEVDAGDSGTDGETMGGCSGFISDGGVCCVAEACDGIDNDCDGVVDDGVLGFGEARAFGTSTTTLLAVVPVDDNKHVVLLEQQPTPGKYSIYVTEVDAEGVRVVDSTTSAGSSNVGSPAKRAIGFKYGEYVVFGFWRSGLDARFFAYDPVTRTSFPGSEDGLSALLSPTSDPAKLRVLGSKGCPGGQLQSYLLAFPDLSNQAGELTDIPGTLADCPSFVSMTPQSASVDATYFLNGANVARITSAAMLEMVALSPGTYTGKHLAREDATGNVGYLYSVTAAAQTKTRFDLRRDDLAAIGSLDLTPATSSLDDGFAMSSSALDDGTWLVARPVEDSSGAATKLRFVVERFAVEDDALVEVNTNFGPCDDVLCPEKAAGAPLRTHVVETGGEVLVGVSQAKGGATFIPYGCH